MERTGPIRIGVNRWIRREWVGIVLCVLGPTWGLAEPVEMHPRSITDSHEPVISDLFPIGISAGSTTLWVIRGRNLSAVSHVRTTDPEIEVLELRSSGDDRLEVRVRASAKARHTTRELRVESPAGLSNLLLFQVDTLRETREAEPNNIPEEASDAGVNCVVNGHLEDRDVDHIRVRGPAGHRLTVEIETRRLGSPLLPVLTLLDLTGRSLMQLRGTPGLDGDSRATVQLPGDGALIVRVHDELYQSGPGASYRLRFTDELYATALFPLGGARGTAVDVTASGGTLEHPLLQRIEVSDPSGALSELKPFQSSAGPVILPHRFQVGDGPEVFERSPAHTDRDPIPTRIPLGGTANGRIDRPGEIDRYVLTVRRGDRITMEIQAATLGSWLDSVLVVRKSAGPILAENDDTMASGGLRHRIRSGLSTGFPTESRVDHQADADEDWWLEVSDRYGNFGPEYAYRLTVTRFRADFGIRFAADLGAKTQGSVRPPEWVLNLVPGSTRRIPLQIVPEGRPSAIQLRAVGLPAGVTAEPVTVRIRPEAGRDPTGVTRGRAQAVRAELILRVDQSAAPATARLEVIGTCASEGGSTLSRSAYALVPIYDWQSLPARQSNHWELENLPIQVLESLKSLRPD